MYYQTDSDENLSHHLFGISYFENTGSIYKSKEYHECTRATSLSNNYHRMIKMTIFASMNRKARKKGLEIRLIYHQLFRVLYT